MWWPCVQGTWIPDREKWRGGVRWVEQEKSVRTKNERSLIKLKKLKLEADFVGRDTTGHTRVGVRQSVCLSVFEYVVCVWVFVCVVSVCVSV